jgi:hypothetical protein
VAYIRVDRPYQGNNAMNASTGSWPGLNETGSPMASGSATSGTIPRSRRWRTAGTMSPWRRNDSPRAAKWAAVDFGR